LLSISYSKILIVKEVNPLQKTKKGGKNLSNNGKYRRNLFDPIVVLLRLFRSVWERQNIMTGESNVIDDDEAREELEDKLDPPSTSQDN
jgi:hypothetical protein